MVQNLKFEKEVNDLKSRELEAIIKWAELQEENWNLSEKLRKSNKIIINGNQESKNLESTLERKTELLDKTREILLKKAAFFESQKLEAAKKYAELKKENLTLGKQLKLAKLATNHANSKVKKLESEALSDKGKAYKEPTETTKVRFNPSLITVNLYRHPIGMV